MVTIRRLFSTDLELRHVFDEYAQVLFFFFLTAFSVWAYP